MMAETKSNQTFSGSIPKVYDEVLVPIYFEPFARDLVNRIAELNPGSVLETACGTGCVTVQLENKLKSEITATDLNPEMMSIAQRKLDGKKITWQLADALALPFADSAFDCVVSQFGVMFYKDKIKGFSEAHRVLKPGGKFLFNVWGKLEANPMSATGREVVQKYFENNPPAYYNVPYAMTNVEEVKGLVKSAGFGEVDAEILTKDCTCESARVMATGLVEGNLIANAIRERDPDAVEILKEKVFHTLVERFGDHPCKTTMQAIVFTAKKKS